MDKIDFSNYKFRCSGLPILMTNGRSKSDPLSETAKAALRDVYILETFKREKYDTSNKYTEKGILCEPDAMDLVQEVKKETYFKNKTRFENDFINGTPDIVIGLNTPEAKVKDTKNSWDIWTFGKVDEKYALSTYYWQMLGYMWLTNAKEAELLFTLVNTPEEIINDELYKLQFKFPEINESEEKAAKYRRNYIFDDIDKAMRVKSFVIPFAPEDVDKLKEKVILARAYLSTLSL